MADVPGVRGSWFNSAQGDERLYVLEAGPRDAGAPTLVLFHGVGEVGTGDFYPVLAKISRTRHVLAVDQPGFGRSKVKGDDFGPDRLVAAVAEVVRGCAREKLDLLGHSSGAALALLFAADERHDVRRLVLVDVAGLLRPEVLLSSQLHHGLTPMREKAPRVSRAAQAVGTAVIHAIEALVPNAKSIAETGLLGQSPSVRAATALLDYNFGYALERVRAPSLILWGEKDEVAPPRVAHLLDDRLPNSRLEFIADGAHVLMKDQPDRMAEAVTKYLSGPVEATPEPGNKPSRGDYVCKGEADVTLEGRYDDVTFDRCERFRLNGVHAKSISIRESEGRIDESKITAGLIVQKSSVSVTAGHIEGTIALEARESRLDLAGVVVRGEKAAIRAHEGTELILSITHVHSPLSDLILHESMEIEKSRDY